MDVFEWINFWSVILVVIFLMVLTWAVEDWLHRRTQRAATTEFLRESMTHYTRDGKDYVIPTRIVKQRKHRNALAMEHARDGAHKCIPMCPGWPDQKERPYDHEKEGL